MYIYVGAFIVLVITVISQYLALTLMYSIV